MDAAACVKEFERIAERLGIETRSVSGVPSGLCTVKGRRVLFNERELDPAGILAVYVREFRGLDMSGLFVPPAIRRMVECGDDARQDW